MLFSNEREYIRQAYVEAWRKQQAGEPLDPLQRLIASVVQMHPEYQPLLERGDTDFEQGPDQSNPFLHMGLHIAILEQVQTDRPEGIRAVYQKLVSAQGDAHQAEHGMMMCLEQALWRAQQTNQMPDEQQYLENLRRLI